MNPEARKELDRILSKSPDTLTETEKAFLRARVSYLTPNQEKEFKDVLKETPKTKKSK